MIGVPCSSVPLTIRTLLPFSRWYLANTSEGTPNPATWPMWRGPLAYGHATATRICSGIGRHHTSVLWRPHGELRNEPARQPSEESSGGAPRDCDHEEREEPH